MLLLKNALNYLTGLKSKAKTKRVNVRLEPWEEVAEGKFKVKFSWNPDIKIPIVDANGTPITGNLPLFSGSTCKIAFVQKPYSMPDSDWYCTAHQSNPSNQCCTNGGLSDAGNWMKQELLHCSVNPKDSVLMIRMSSTSRNLALLQELRISDGLPLRS